MTTIVVNLYGGPGAGKSTTRAGVFHILKRAFVNCEEVTEVAKELVWEERHFALAHQPYIFGKMLRNIERLIGKVDVIITDSPINLAEYYARKNTPNRYPESFYTFVRDVFEDEYGGKTLSLNYFLNRVKPYHTAGRYQTEEEAREIDIELKEMLHQCQVDFDQLPGDEKAKWVIALRVGQALYRLNNDREAYNNIHKMAIDEGGMLGPLD